MFASRLIPHSAGAVAWRRPEAAPCKGWRHRAAGTPVKTKDGKPGRVKPAAACTADPEAAAGGAHQGAAAVCVFIHRWNETKGLLAAGGGRLDKQLSIPSLSSQIRLG